MTENRENTPALRKQLITNSIHILKDAISFDQFFKLEALYYVTLDGDDTKILEINSEDIWSRSNLRDAVLTLDSTTTEIKDELSDQPTCSTMCYAAEKKQCPKNSVMNENTPALRKQLITDSIYILKDAISFEQFFKLEALYYITKDGDRKKSLGINSEDVWSKSNLRETVLPTEIKLEPSEQEPNYSTGMSEQPGCSNMSYAAETNQPTDISQSQDHGEGNLDELGNGPVETTDVAHHQKKKLVLECAVLVKHMEVHMDSKKYYKCRFCFKMFSRRRKLVKHEYCHAEKGSNKSPARGSIVKRDGQSHAKRRFQCKICEKSFSSDCYLQSHIRALHVGEKPFHCETCDKSFAWSGQLKRHIRTHTGEKPYHCTICEKSFAQAETLQLHIRAIHVGEKPYHCETCEKSFARSDHLKRHVQTHVEEKPFHCETCGKSFTQYGHLKDHNRTHTREKPYHCETCNKSFARSGDLKSHIRTHTGEKPYHCTICEKSFTQAGSLQLHIRAIHVGEKPYHCETCDKSFARSGHVKEHIRTHTGEKPYHCETCDKSFARSGDLKIHIRTHTGEKPYHCEACDKSFALSGYLKSHMRTHHTDEKPYQCSNCLERFSWHNQLKKHLEVSCGGNLK